jgi:putative colanic acid biosysnthesis UDP-glucose lipid carrier transferase
MKETFNPNRKNKGYFKTNSHLFQPGTIRNEDRRIENLKKPGSGFRFSFLLIDIAAINLIYFTAVQLTRDINFNTHYLLLLFAYNFLWIVSTYSTAVYFASEGFVKKTFSSFVIHFSLVLFFIFLYKYSYSRLFILSSFIAFGVTLLVIRTIVIGGDYLIKRKHKFQKKFVVLGFSQLSVKLTKALITQDKGYELAGYFDDITYNTIENAPLMCGNLTDCVSYAINNNIQEIYSTITPEANNIIYDIAYEAERNFIRFKIVPDFDVFINRQVHIGFVDDIPVLSLREEPLQHPRNQLKKRLFDVAFSSLVICCILSWLIPVIAILIKLESKGPVFFKQLRSGKNNVPFLCFKFRSLQVNSNADNMQVTRNDQRFTRIGKFLRKTNIDELPQFFNVFQGYMSIVGPRPHMLKHTRQYSEIINQYMVRHFVKPGITGWAQINGYRGEIKKEEQLRKRVECDINYMENWSMWLDMRIIALTVYKTIVGDKNAF